MTTIAYRAGVLAADSMISYGGFRNGNTVKIKPVTMRRGQVGNFSHEKVMIAMSGICWPRQPMIEWIEEGCPQDEIPQVLLMHAKDFACLMVDSLGKLFEFNNGYWLECDVEYHAIGSGSQFALGAMAAGVSAPEAVLAASCHDKATGGDITVMTVADLNFKAAA